MNTLKQFCIVLLLCASLLVLNAAHVFAEMPLDLTKTIKDYEQAQVNNDVVTLDHLVTDDFVLVNSDSSVQNKKSFLEDFNKPGFKMEPYVLEQKVEKVWGDAAVIGGIMLLKWTQDGKQQSRKLRIVYVWAKRDGHWQTTYAQLTRVPQ
ncbi:nuclear transport factor 2 family protein [bacterium]|nr:nuclear transport factor 2 family protein [bacterium]